MVIIADSVTVYCETRGVHRPTVTWMKGIEVLSNSSSAAISESVGPNGTVNSSLTISMFSRSDAGEYSCSVTNSAGNDTAIFQLTIQGECLLLDISDFCSMCDAVNALPHSSPSPTPVPTLIHLPLQPPSLPSFISLSDPRPYPRSSLQSLLWLWSTRMM